MRRWLWRNRLYSVGCIVCRNLGRGWVGPVPHHLRAGMGGAMRNDDYHAIPLCNKHHTSGGHGEAFHAGQAAWEEKFGTERELLEQMRKIGRYEDFILDEQS